MFKRLRITTLLAMVIFCVLITISYLLGCSRRDENTRALLYLYRFMRKTR